MGKLTFDQLCEDIQAKRLEVEQVRFCQLVEDVIHVVLYRLVPSEHGLGDIMMTREQFKQFQDLFPEIQCRKTGSFPIPLNKPTAR